ncbi:MAG: hypothetical protein A3C53_07975 [Omnitrophica WOR_2 bacterium RIFCSPHIGHO2_02_FULL_68_15]|nr:MAG: hypothetical protein A3C53_07975 [Omnitrophica WOR_2 bacterium RIFCSPHIGHO2_02_FULL_68_15]
MTPRVILDENVSLRVADRLRALGYDVLAIVQHPARGMNDTAVFELVNDGPGVLITRDAHFTNPVRFPVDKTAGIIYLTHGNLRSLDEVRLVEQFLTAHPPETFKGRLVSLSPSGARIR